MLISTTTTHFIPKPASRVPTTFRLTLHNAAGAEVARREVTALPFPPIDISGLGAGTYVARAVRAATVGTVDAPAEATFVIDEMVEVPLSLSVVLT